MTMYRSRLVQAFWRDSKTAVVQRYWPEHGPCALSIMAEAPEMEEANRKCEEWICRAKTKHPGIMSDLARLEETLEDLTTAFGTWSGRLIA